MTSVPAEFQCLLNAGLISSEEVAELMQRARAHGVGPIELLYQDGLLSDQTMVDLQQESMVFAATLEGATSPKPEGNPAPEPQSPEAKPSLPEHYQLGELLGRGAMGKVYRALDMRLQRQVAVKFVIGDDPLLVTRFVREARAQARVEHENLCKVFEVGEEAGNPFIVMQLIQGEPLNEIAVGMTLEQKLLVMKAAAEAVHEANRAGLIHRDLKPGNILVEQLADGSYKPTVMDFGLARLTTDHELTMDGTVLGTPGYMSPEQACGESALLDRRTDVYGLGATLYHLLTQQPPFTGPSLGPLLMRIQEDMPTQPRQLQAGVPRDVETIALKCLEKEPDDRYASARALAEDIGRYLDGVPILASPAGIIHRSALLVRKHRVLFGTVISGLMLLVLSLVWGVWRSSVRAALERNLTEQVTRIEALARHIYMSRPHDTRPSLAQLQQRMEAMRTSMDQAGAMAEGPGHYALGRGYLALGETDTALLFFHRAIELGYRTPQTRFSLGLANYHLYLKHFNKVNDTLEKAQRQQRLVQLGQQYRDPALALLSSGEEHGLASSEYQQALIAFLEERFEDALASAQQVAQAQPWFYEAHALAANVYKMQALQPLLAGRKEEARALLLQAVRCFEQARDIAPSAPEHYRGIKHALQLSMLEEYDQAVWGPCVAQLEQTLDALLIIVPHDAETYLDKARVFQAQARRQAHKNQDPSKAYALALSAAARADQLGSARSATALTKGTIHWEMAQWAMRRRQDITARIAEAVTQLERVAEADRDYRFYYNFGAALKVQGIQPDVSDACGILDRAVDAYQRSVAIKADWVGSRHGLANALFHRAKVGNCAGSEPMALLQQALTTEEKAIALYQTYAPAHYLKAHILLLMARGGDDKAVALDETLGKQALNAFQQAIDLSPGNTFSYYTGLSWAQCALGRNAWLSGADPTLYLQGAVQTCRQALTRFPGSEPLLHHLALAHLFLGKYQMRQGHDPTVQLDTTIQTIEQAYAAVPDPEYLIVAGSAYRFQAEFQLLKGQNPNETINKARAVFLRILEDEPKYFEALRSLGRLATLEARQRILFGADATESLASATAYLNEARRIKPNSRLLYMATARLAFHKAGIYSGSLREAAVAEGLQALAQIHRRHSDYGEVAMLEAALSLRGNRLAHVRAWKRDALGKNPNLITEARLVFGLL